MPQHNLEPLKKSSYGRGRFSKDNPGKPFPKGSPGRPKGTLNRVTLAAQALLDGQTEAITEACIQGALAREPLCIKLCIERILPPRKELPVQFTMPPLQSGADVAAAMGAVMNAVAEGKLLLSQGLDFAKLLEIYNRTVNFVGLTDIEKMTDDEMRSAILRLQAMAATDADVIEPVAATAVPNDVCDASP